MPVARPRPPAPDEPGHMTTDGDHAMSTTKTPLADAYVAAAAACASADKAFCDLPDEDCEEHGPRLWDALVAAEAALESARKAWLESDEVREWEYRGDSLCDGRERGHWSAPSKAEADLRDWAESASYDVPSMVVVRDEAYAIDPVTGEAIDDGSVSSSVEVQPAEPPCDDEDHDWRKPHEVVGGDERNPGVWGSGAGIEVREVCATCGQYRITDTDAQDRATGERGHTAVRYRAANVISREWIRSLE